MHAYEDRHVLSASSSPLHIEGTETEIDTAWQPATGAWQYQMTLADYRAYARNALNAGDLIQYTHPGTGENVVFQPLSLNWVNQDNSRQQITTTQYALATVADDTLTWTNGYGTGRHFSWQAQTTRLQKLLKIDSAANLPAPAAWLTGTLWLELEFIIKKSGNLHLYLDGVKWAENTTRVRTANRIEFRHAVSGEVLWYLAYPRAWDSAHNETVGQFELRRQSNSYYITVRIPKTWVDSAVFPIFIDPTIDAQPNASNQDGKWGLFYGSGELNETDSELWVGNRIAGSRENYSVFARIASVAVPSGATIDAAYLRLRSLVTLAPTTFYASCWMVDADNPATPTTYDAIESAPRTAASSSWNNPAVTNGAWVNTSSLAAAIQEVIDRPGWVSGNAMIAAVENNGSGASTYLPFASYNTSSSYAPILHIEYSTGGSPVSILPTGIASAEAFGSPTVSISAAIAPSGIPSTEQFGSASVQSAYTITGSGIPSEEQAGTPTITAHNDVYPTGIPSGEQVSGPAVVASNALAPGSIGSAEQFGAPTVVATNTLAPQGIGSAEQFGSASVVSHYEVTSAGIPSQEAFGEPSVVPGGVYVSVQGVPSAEQFGQPTITAGFSAILPAGIPSQEAFGTPGVPVGGVTVSAQGIASAETFGTPSTRLGIQASSIAGAEAFGTPTVSVGARTLQPTSIASLEAFGQAALAVGPIAVYPTGIDSAEAVGTPALNNLPPPTYVTPAGIVSGEAHGTPVLAVGGVGLSPAGVASAEAFGAGVVVPGPVQIYPEGFVDSDQFGVPTLDNTYRVYPVGIYDGAVGFPTVLSDRAILAKVSLADQQVVVAALVDRRVTSLRLSDSAATDVTLMEE